MLEKVALAVERQLFFCIGFGGSGFDGYDGDGDDVGNCE